MKIKVSGESGHTAILSTSHAVALLCLLGFGLRMVRLGFQPLWGDEGWSFYFASMPMDQMLAKTAIDIHPPLYYALLGLWLKLIGSTPESGRLLSVLFGTLLIPLTYALARRVFGRASGLICAAIVVLAPFAIYYSQEVRMYGLVTLLGVASCYFLVSYLRDRAGIRFLWLAYILTTAAALYTMYYAGFLIVTHMVFLVASWMAARRPLVPNRTMQRYRNLIAALFVVGSLYLPWIIYSGTELLSYVQGKREAEGYAALGLLEFLRAHLVAFSLGHLPENYSALAWGSILFIGLTLLGICQLLYTVKSPPYRGDPPQTGHLLLVSVLLVPLSLGYLINLLFPFTPAYFERTLMLAAPAWWILTGAGMIWLRSFQRSVFRATAALLIVLSAVSLYAFYSVPRYRDNDYRQLLSVVKAHSSTQDVLLASYQWQAGLYHAYLSSSHPVFYEVPEWGALWAADCVKMQDDLDSLLAAHPRLWFPAYQSLGRLWETDVEQTLNQAAFPTVIDWRVPSTKLSLYGGVSPLQSIDEAVASSRFGPNLALQQAAVGSDPVQAGRGIVPVSLTWKTLFTITDDYHIVLRLTDTSGFSWANRDSLPQGGTVSFIELSAGETLVDHHGLLLPAGTPPGSYQLRLSVYPELGDHPLDILDDQGQPRGTEILLAEVQVLVPEPPVLPDALPAYEPVDAHIGDTILLLGYSQPGKEVQAGDTLRFSLFWQGLAANNQSYIGFAQLQDDAGHPVALSEVPPAYPTDHWQSGTLVRDPRQIVLPAALPAGSYRLAVGLMQADGTRLKAGRYDQVVLTTVQTVQRDHNYAPPTPQVRQIADFDDLARLVGYDLPESEQNSIEAGTSLELTLFWRARGGSDQDYSVFAHLVDSEGNIVGQHDQIPGGGKFPTTTWVPDEYLVDHYTIPISPGAPQGIYLIELGFYHPRDGRRLQVTDQEGQVLGDHLLLVDTPIQIR